MQCPSCKNEVPSGTVCDMCGAELGTAAAPPPGAPPRDPAVKRKTVFEPEPPRASPPAHAQAPPAAPDFFSRPPPPRPVFNPQDPFASSPSRAYAPAEAPMPQAAPPPKARTIIDSSSPVASAERVRGALFEYRGPGDPGRVHGLREGRNVIGRDPASDVRLEDGRASATHAYLFVRAEDATFMDVSTNGSLVEGRAVHGEQVVLQNQIRIQIGESFLMFVMLPAALFG